MNTNPASLRVDCPFCGAKRAAVLTVQCSKWFIPGAYLDPAGKRAGRVKDVCPYCHTDRDQWFEDYYSRKRR